MKPAIFGVLVLGLLSACHSLPQTSPSFDLKQNLHQHQLDNGFKILIKEDHRSPVVMTQVWYKVGGNNEPVGKGGISHFVEHLMFKDTPSVSGDDFSRLISHYGGRSNAYTNANVTVYYEQLPANRYPMALELEANRMQNLIFDPAQINSERQVILEERRKRTDDNPMAKAYEEFLGFIYQDVRGRPVIGSVQEINTISVQDLQNWYQTWYTPNNATLVVVGDVNPQEVIATAKRYFGNITSRPLPASPQLSQAPPQTPQNRHLDTHQNVQVPSLVLAWHTPTLNSLNARQQDPKDAYALALLANVLDGGSSARFEKHLVRQGDLLSSVSVSYQSDSPHDGLFIITATPKQGISLDTAKQAILDELARTLNQPISHQEFLRATTAITTAQVFGADNLSQQAQTIGRLNFLGLPFDQTNITLQAINALSTDDLHMVGKRYLSPQTMYSAYVLPKNNQDKK